VSKNLPQGKSGWGKARERPPARKAFSGTHKLSKKLNKKKRKKKKGDSKSEERRVHREKARFEK